ncbi:MAG: hypothetical protein H8E90_04165 [Anaerolineales bacterium]|nr:hypothetical protein [Anaerolineales bacterium]
MWPRCSKSLYIETGKLCATPTATSVSTRHAFHCRVVSGEPQALGCADVRWVQFDEFPRFPFSVADQKIIAVLQNAVWSEPAPR